MMLVLAVVMLVLLGGGAVMVFAEGPSKPSQKRVAALGKPDVRKPKNDPNAARKRNMQAAIKDFEKKQAEKKPSMTLRRRLDQAGLAQVTERNFWIASAALAGIAVLFCFLKGQSLIVVVLAAFAAGLGLPRWALSFLKKRREKKFTADFANAIDVIVRSVKSGLPTGDALRIVAQEFREPVGGEFKKLVEGQQVEFESQKGPKGMQATLVRPLNGG